MKKLGSYKGFIIYSDKTQIIAKDIDGNKQKFDTQEEAFKEIDRLYSILLSK